MGTEMGHKGPRRLPTDPDVRAAIRDGAIEGLGPTGILDRIAKTDRFKGRIPSLRTVKRYAKEPPREPSEPWALSEADLAEARLVMPVLAAVLERTDGRRTHVTREEARLITRIRLAAPGIPHFDAYQMARQMLWAGPEWEDVAVLHHYIAFRPWTSEGRARYDAANRGTAGDMGGAGRRLPHMLAWSGPEGEVFRYETIEDAFPEGPPPAPKGDD